MVWHILKPVLGCPRKDIRGHSIEIEPILMVPFQNLIKVFDVLQSKTRSILDAPLIEGLANHRPVSCDGLCAPWLAVVAWIGQFHVNASIAIIDCHRNLLGGG
jgi:hypothetical protein